MTAVIWLLVRLLWDEKLNTDTLVAYLRDNYTNKETEVKKTGNTDVEYLIDADARSSAVDRFEIFFKSIVYFFSIYCVMFNGSLV